MATRMRRWLGLEPVADIGQGPVHDRAHGVGEIAVLEFLLDLQVFDPVGRRISFCHKEEILRDFDRKIILPPKLPLGARCLHFPPVPIDLSPYQAVLLDLDGTVYHENQPLPAPPS